MNRVRNNRGTSVVEVLVVMVVLFVGILVVLNLFPPGFLSVRYSENMTIAGRLAQYEIERWKNNADNLPEGVLPIDSSGVVLNNLFPGPKVNDGNARAFRRIVGETTRIPFGGWSTGPQSGSIYILAFSPIAGAPVVRGGSLTRRILDSSDPSAPDSLRAYQYGIDYGGQGEIPQVCFHPDGQPRVFYVTCSWWEQQGSASPQYRTSMNLRIDVAAGFSDWIRLPLAVTSTFLSFDEYSDTVSRGFRDVTGAGSWSTSDVYEYKIVNGTLGIIEFNPLGYTRTEFGQSLEAKIDYDILDPAIIREDKRAPSAAPYRIDLTLKRIAKKNETWIRDVAAADDSMFQGLPVAGNPDLIAIDLESGKIVDWTSNTSRTPEEYILVNHRDGAVELVPDGSGMLLMTDGSRIPVAGRNFRFLYKADGDWSVQFLKAYAQYERSNTSTLDYKSYYVDGSKPTWIWFSACNGNHSISVDYEWDDNGTIRKVIGETHKTSDILLDAPPGPPGTRWTHIELAHTPTNYVSVTGVSVRARVVWRDGDRWRNVDLDTTLVREKSDN